MLSDLNINNVNLDYDDIKKWLPSLIKIETKLLLALGYPLDIEELAKKRFFLYGYVTQEEAGNTKISSFLNYESEKQDTAPAAATANSNKDYYQIASPALRIEAERDLEKLSNVINEILFSPKNWIVIENIVDAAKTIIFKPLNIASYCAPIFNKCSKVLIMSATILDHLSFCKSIGLPHDEDVKFIRVNSDFPEARRPIYSLRIHPLNYRNLQESEVRVRIAKSIDEIMNEHKNHKGIIHITSYAQNNFIINNLSEQNRDRLIQTDPNIPREEIIWKHINSSEPTVLISPSLYMGWLFR